MAYKRIVQATFWAVFFVMQGLRVAREDDPLHLLSMRLG